MRILFEKDTIGNLPHVRIGIDITGREITLVATEEDSETKEITIIGTAKFNAKKTL